MANAKTTTVQSS